MEKEDAISDIGWKVPKNILRQEKKADQDSDRKGEKAGGGSEMVEMEVVAISSEVPKVIGSIEKVPYQNPDGVAEGAVGGAVDKQEQVLDKITAQIQELSSGGGGKEEEPTENNSDDLILLQILPREIWKKVTEFVDAAEDFYNLGKSSPFFKDLLEPKRVLYLFPSVLEILGKRFLENYQKPGVYNELFNEKDSTMARPPATICACGGRRKIQSFSGILKLRLVSKIWSNAVDTFIRNDTRQQGHDQVALRDESTMWIANWSHGYQWGGDVVEPQFFTRFQRHFDGTHAVNGEGGPGSRSPFLLGAVPLGGDPAVGINMLQLYGHHVQQCYFTTWNSRIEISPSPLAAYSLYRRAIELMPNLKQIEFEYLVRRIYWEGIDRERDALLREEMTLRPMPLLKNLQLLSFSSGGDPRTFNSFLKINSHVSTLIIVNIHDWQEDDLDLYTFPLPNLTRLRVDYSYERNFLKFVGSEFKFKLTHLDLTFDYIPEQLSVVFDGISRKCGDTLTDLRIAFFVKGNEDEVRGFQEEVHELRLNLPQLKTFIFESQRFCSLEFLLSANQTLEYLKVEFGLFRGDNMPVEEKELVVDRKGTLRFLSCTSRNRSLLEGTLRFLSCTSRDRSLLDSNIWELFPKLKEIRYSDFVEETRFSIIVTRQQWELKQKKVLGKDKDSHFYLLIIQ